jgi:hypothetical protein
MVEPVMAHTHSSGPAFPVRIDNTSSAEVVGFDGRPVKPGTAVLYGGRTLRDYFAAKAMQALISSNDEGAGDRIEEVPKYAYMIADAMLKARAE